MGDMNRYRINGHGRFGIYVEIKNIWIHMEDMEDIYRNGIYGYLWNV